jgi:HEAT repeats
MRRALALVVAVLFISQAHAGDKKSVITAERVGQLLTILRSDLNEDNRVHAAEELGRVDGSKYPEIVPLLIEALKSDPKPAVRAEIVDSLAKIRPLTKEAGKALDQAKEDGSFKVRWHARTAARVYHTAGFPEQDKKIAGVPAKQTPSQPAFTSETLPAPQSGGWLANLRSKPASSSDTIVTKPQAQAQPAPTESTQSGGWLYHMLAKPSTAPKTSATPVEPPMAQSNEIVFPKSDPPPAIPTGGTNPFTDIRSAPATQASPPKVSPYMPQAPVVPVLPSKPADGGQG